ncbi:MAG: N-6 DNA methylase [Anaerolineae bacterium]
MSIPARVAHLVEHFHANRADLRSPHYNETQVRREFIDPLFKALGWDVDNEGSAPEAYKDVIHEDAVKIGGVTKAPDYSFRVGGERKFFVEAKKPAVNLRTDTSPAFQLRRYAWSANLPISILTDFEEFIVYDCRVRPDQADRADTARILYLTYEHYLDQWDSIAGLFARDAVLHGALDQYVDTLKTHRGVATVDAAFLREIEGWRDTLARDIARRNPGLGQRDLNFAVQMTIDRVIFLRMAEDRGIEPYGELLALCNGANVYERLAVMFKQADDRYNSGLFHFKRERGRDDPDDLTLDLRVGDEPLKAIFRSLYYPDSPYEFSVLPIEILGHVYEQFLGKVITLTPDHGAVVEEKPEVRKAGGVYYTPTYIVDYIVEHTIGKLLDGKTPRQVAGAGKAAPLRVVDPACGSGSFLIGAYGYLLDWYRRRYVEEGPARHKKELYQGADGEWRLTTAERKRILLDHIYGVDIDAQAVEVTKLSLLLKVLEGENRQVLVRQLRMFQERALPDLEHNIQCGNSLIGPDFYDGQLGLLDDEARYRINVFDWRAAFPQVFQGDNPGFDAVIGNPPYIRIQNLREFQPLEVGYYEKTFASAQGKYDVYVLFLERNIWLLKQQGIFGVIVPNKLLVVDYGKNIRRTLSTLGFVYEIVSFGQLQIFPQASTYTCLLFWAKDSLEDLLYTQFHDLSSVTDDLKRLAPSSASERFSTRVLAAPRNTGEWQFNADRNAEIILPLAKKWTRLQLVTDRVFQGIITGGDKLFLFEIREWDTHRAVVYSREYEREFELESELLRPFMRGSNIKRYSLQKPDFFVLYPYKLRGSSTVHLAEDELQREFPRAWDYLTLARPQLSARGSARMKYPTWYALWNQRDLRLLTSRKLLVPTIATRPSFAIDMKGEFFFLGSGAGGPGAYGITLSQQVESPYYALGLLNSHVTEVFINATSSVFRGGYRAYSQQYLWGIPYRTIDFANAADRARHDRMVAMVEEMLRLHKRLAEARTPHEKTALQHQVDALDRQIDALVYALYGLTDEEIRIVEGGGA